MIKFSFSRLPLFVAFLLLFFSWSGAVGQTEQCGTVPFNDKQGKGEERKQIFEKWMQARMADKRASLPAQRAAEDEPIYTIPVVVHVIHRGEAEGEGSNIPYEQVLDQLETLNLDYRRQNADTTNTPAMFQPVAADTRIEFVLALQDPDGFPTNGVVRVEGNEDFYGLNSASTLSNLSYWPSDHYLNIWVAPLEPGLLGYASFPVSDLEGLEDTPDNPFTDGVVISYQYFGSIGNASSQSLGRTTTHEIGHFLGLRHIWGDGDCSVDDFVEDTPLQESETNNCPEEKFSCDNENMFQNYMDYTDDVCMNIFTADQKARMRIVLENSKRRFSLLTSPGLTPPTLTDNDAGINSIISPAPSECDGTITPEAVLLNAGENTLTSYTVELFLQGNLVEEKQGTSNLETGESTTLTFNTLNLGENPDFFDNYEISIVVTQANGEVDENTGNNEKSVAFIIPQQGELPVAEDFEDPESTFLTQAIIRNPDNVTTWELVDAPGFGEDNQALYLNFYDYESAFGEKDELYTATYDFSNLESATLKFRYAYAPFLDDDEAKLDAFRVGVSLDCGATLDSLIFDEAGEDLATVPAINQSFVPESRADWKTVELPLDTFLGQNNVQIAFIGVNDYGNNLYLDDIQIITQVARDVDVAIARIDMPPVLSCTSSIDPLLFIKNEGNETIQRFEVTYQVDEQAPTSFVYDAFPLAPGEEKELSFEVLDLSTGLHTLDVSITQPNLQTDEQIEDNYRTYAFYIDDNQDFIPLVNDFQTAPLPDVLSGENPENTQDWLVVNPDSSITWEITEAAGNGNNNTAAFINNFVYEEIGSADRLVSPTLDFSNTDTASVFFKVSYALLGQNYIDTLRVLVSVDCGQTYTTVYEESGTELSVTETDTAWVPAQESDWKEQFIDLSDFAGEPDVRVAFEVVNGYGNNLYLDDIEFYLTNTSELVRIEENTYRIYPNPTDGWLKAVFNLLEREEVGLALYDMRGQLLWQRTFPFTLNQTYNFNLGNQPAGVYILRVNSPSINTSQRFIIY